MSGAQRSYIATDRVLGALEAAEAWARSSPWLGTSEVLAWLRADLDIEPDPDEARRADTWPAPAPPEND